MPQLLLEFLTEEIPARMQARAADDLAKALQVGLQEAGFQTGDVRSYAGPRRLVAVAEDVPARSADVREERKGPRIDAPQKALEGFLRGAGLESLEACETRDDKKGSYYVAVIDKPGRAAPEAIAEIVPAIIRGFAWPKSMRWGAGSLRWVRPLQRIVCLFDGAVVPFEVDGIASGNLTEGHRVMGPGPFTVTGFDDYAKTLATTGKVILDAAERQALIARDAHALCKKAGLELVDDPGLLAEVAGLAEWPVVLLGDMDPAFLDLPPEVIRLSMRTHQKYFAVRDPEATKKAGAERLAPKFVVVANQVAPDGGAAIAAGNARVLAARLNDARFFWDNDKKAALGTNIPKLQDITFHAKLGTVFDKTARLEALAKDLAGAMGLSARQVELAGVAAKLAKADLVSQMVYEFPELQGVMGRYYALAEAGLNPLEPTKKAKGATPADWASAVKPAEVRAVADAIAQHYQPQGPSDAIPEGPIAKAVALADKLDTLVGFWAIDEKPTGSKDPFALRRAALGVIRILLGDDAVSSPARGGGVGEADGGGSVGADHAPSASLRSAPPPHAGEEVRLALFETIHVRLLGFHNQLLARSYAFDPRNPMEDPEPRNTATLQYDEAHDLLAFFADRLKVHLREEGLRHDVIDAVFAPNLVTGAVDDDLVRVTKRARALQAFLGTDDGANLLAGYRRGVNILRAEEKKAKSSDSEALPAGAPDPAAFEKDEERALHESLAAAQKNLSRFLEMEDFAAAMGALSPLRSTVDRFFDAVTVNAEDTVLRRNRLLLLLQFRDAFAPIGDLSKLEG